MCNSILPRLSLYLDNAIIFERKKKWKILYVPLGSGLQTKSFLRFVGLQKFALIKNNFVLKKKKTVQFVW